MGRGSEGPKEPWLRASVLALSLRLVRAGAPRAGPRLPGRGAKAAGGRGSGHSRGHTVAPAPAFRSPNGGRRSRCLSLRLAGPQPRRESVGGKGTGCGHRNTPSSEGAVAPQSRRLGSCCLRARGPTEREGARRRPRLSFIARRGQPPRPGEGRGKALPPGKAARGEPRCGFGRWAACRLLPLRGGAGADPKGVEGSASGKGGAASSPRGPGSDPATLCPGTSGVPGSRRPVLAQVWPGAPP